MAIYLYDSKARAWIQFKTIYYILLIWNSLSGHVIQIKCTSLSSIYCHYIGTVNRAQIIAINIFAYKFHLLESPFN